MAVNGTILAVMADTSDAEKKIKSLGDLLSKIEKDAEIHPEFNIDTKSIKQLEKYVKGAFSGLNFDKIFADINGTPLDKINKKIDAYISRFEILSKAVKAEDISKLMAVPDTEILSLFRAITDKTNPTGKPLQNRLNELYNKYPVANGAGETGTGNGNGSAIGDGIGFANNDLQQINDTLVSIKDNVQLITDSIQGASGGLETAVAQTEQIAQNIDYAAEAQKKLQEFQGKFTDSQVKFQQISGQSGLPEKVYSYIYSLEEAYELLQDFQEQSKDESATFSGAYMKDLAAAAYTIQQYDDWFFDNKLWDSTFGQDEDITNALKHNKLVFDNAKINGTSIKSYIYDFISQFNSDLNEIAKIQLSTLNPEMFQKIFPTDFEIKEQEIENAASSLQKLNQEMANTNIGIDLTNEIEQFQNLGAAVDNVTKSIESKTNALINESKTMDDVAAQEIKQLEKINEVALKKQELDYTKVNMLTDPNGEFLTLYRGTSGIYGGLGTSIGYNTLYTSTSPYTAKQYMKNGKAFDVNQGKVQAFNIKAKNPLEIDAHGNNWNYIGGGKHSTLKKEIFQSEDIKDEAIQLKEDLQDLRRDLNHEIGNKFHFSYGGQGEVLVTDQSTGETDFLSDMNLDIDVLDTLDSYSDAMKQAIKDKLYQLKDWSIELKKIFEQDIFPHEYSSVDDIDKWLKKQNIFDAAIVHNIDDAYDKSEVATNVLLKYPKEQIVDAHTVDSKTGIPFNEKEIDEEVNEIKSTHKKAKDIIDTAKEIVEEEVLEAEDIEESIIEFEDDEEEFLDIEDIDSFESPKSSLDFSSLKMQLEYLKTFLQNITEFEQNLKDAGMTPSSTKNDFEYLLSDAFSFNPGFSTEGKNINGGFTNLGGFIGNDYSFIAREKKYLPKTQDLIAHTKEALKLNPSANIGQVVDYVENEASDLIYEIQKTMPGIGIGEEEIAEAFNKNIGELALHFQHFFEDIQTMARSGLYVDTGGESNILFDPEKGFSFIDLATLKNDYTTQDPSEIFQYLLESIAGNVNEDLYNRINYEAASGLQGALEADWQTFGSNIQFDTGDAIDQQFYDLYNALIKKSSVKNWYGKALLDSPHIELEPSFSELFPELDMANSPAIAALEAELIADVKDNEPSEDKFLSEVKEVNSELEEQIELLNQSKMNADNIVYHQGNLTDGYMSHPFGDEVISFFEGLENGGNPWGNGTGTYFLHNVDVEDGFPPHDVFSDKSPLQYYAIDTSKLNLKKFDTEETAQDFLNFIHQLEQYCITFGSEFDDFGENLKEIDSDSTLYEKFQKIFPEIELEYKQFSQFIDEMIELTEESQMEKTGNIPNITEFYKENGQDDIKTRFMKMLGYQGIDFGGTSLDSLDVGGVLFDNLANENLLTNSKSLDEVLSTAQQIVEAHNKDIDQKIDELKVKKESEEEKIIIEPEIEVIPKISTEKAESVIDEVEEATEEDLKHLFGKDKKIIAPVKVEPEIKTESDKIDAELSPKAKKLKDNLMDSFASLIEKKDLKLYSFDGMMDYMGMSEESLKTTTKKGKDKKKKKKGKALTTPSVELDSSDEETLKSEINDKIVEESEDIIITVEPEVKIEPKLVTKKAEEESEIISEKEKHDLKEKVSDTLSPEIKPEIKPEIDKKDIKSVDTSEMLNTLAEKIEKETITVHPAIDVKFEEDEDYNPYSVDDWADEEYSNEENSLKAKVNAFDDATEKITENVHDSISAIEEEKNAGGELSKAFLEAAKAKEQFAEANKQVADSGQMSSVILKNEQDAVGGLLVALSTDQFDQMQQSYQDAQNKIEARDKAKQSKQLKKEQLNKEDSSLSSEFKHYSSDYKELFNAKSIEQQITALEHLSQTIQRIQKMRKELAAYTDINDLLQLGNGNVDSNAAVTNAIPKDYQKSLEAQLASLKQVETMRTTFIDDQQSLINNLSNQLKSTNIKIVPEVTSGWGTTQQAEYQKMAEGANLATIAIESLNRMIKEMRSGQFDFTDQNAMETFLTLKNSIPEIIQATQNSDKAINNSALKEASATLSELNKIEQSLLTIKEKSKDMFVVDDNLQTVLNEVETHLQKIQNLKEILNKSPLSILNTDFSNNLQNYTQQMIGSDKKTGIVNESQNVLKESETTFKKIPQYFTQYGNALKRFFDYLSHGNHSLKEIVEQMNEVYRYTEKLSSTTGLNPSKLLNGDLGEKATQAMTDNQESARAKYEMSFQSYLTNLTNQIEKAETSLQQILGTQNFKQAFDNFSGEGEQFNNFKTQINDLINHLEQIKNYQKDVKDGGIEFFNEENLKETYDIFKKLAPLLDKEGFKQFSKDASQFKIIDDNTLGEARANMQRFIDLNPALSGERVSAIKNYINQLQSGINNIDYTEAIKGFERIKNAAIEASNTGGTFISELQTRFKSLGTYLLSFVSFYEVINVFKQGINIVHELDDALTEMQKVSDESLGTLGVYQKTTFATANDIGTTAAQLQQSTADWLRLGEDLQQASQSAQTANVLFNVSEFESIDEATTALVAMSAAYADAEKDIDKMDIVDRLNLIGNNYAIATDELATALQDGAATLQTAGNDLDEAIALTTAGNEKIA